MGKIRSNLAPLKYKTLRALRFPPRSLADVAVKRWEIAPGDQEDVQPIPLPEGHLQKIGGGPFGETPDQLRASFTATHLVHEPTEAYLLRNVTLNGPFFYSGMHKGDLYAPNQLPPHATEAEGFADLPHCVLSGTYAGAKWYGHFLHDDLPLQMAAISLGHPVLNARRIYSHEPGWRAAVGIALPDRYHRFFAREMIVISDYSQNRYKQQRLRMMRQKLADRPKTAHRRVYIRRGAGGNKRILINEEEVLSLLQRQLGFSVFDPDGLSVAQIIDECNGAEFFVSVEGSHANPPLFTAAEGAKAVLLLPPFRVSDNMPRIFRTAGIRCGMFVGDPHGNGHDEFTVNPQELARFIETLVQ